MKTVIIGSKGFIGKRLLQLLMERGLDVKGFSSSEPGAIDPQTGILSDEFEIPEGTGAIIYLAQSPYYHQVPERSSHIMNVSVVSAIKMAELARRAKVRRFIYTSTGSVYLPSFEALPETAPLRRDDWYVLSKVHAEEALSLYRNDMDITVARLFGIYGPGQAGKMVPKLLTALLQNQEIYIEKNSGDEKDLDGLRLSFCYIDDVVESLFKLLETGGPAYLNIAGQEIASVRELVILMAECLEKDPVFKISDKYRNFNLIADLSLLRKTINPEFTALRDGIRQTVEYFRLEQPSQ